MPVGYWWTVAVLSWGVACALNRWRGPGPFSKIPALLVSELPFIVAYLLIASTVLALADGDLDSPGGAAGAAVALLALAGLGVVVRRALRAHAALHTTGRPERPWGRILAIRAVSGGEAGIAGLICRYGYYGDLAPGGDMPPMLVVHGEKDILAPVSDARAFVERVRAVSSRPVSYAELPGAHHDFDMFESIRSAAVSQAVDQFTASVS